MKKTRAISGVAITAVALSLVLVGCGSESDKAQESAPTTNTTNTSTPAAAPGTENTAGPNPTIATYVQENHIQETPIHRGDPGAPNVNLPVPEGWADAGGDTPEGAYSAIVYTGPEAAPYTPKIVAKMFKLTGNVDPKKILELAPGELRNLNGWSAANEGSTTTLAGHDAYQIGGAWVDSQTKIVAQKTVVIPRSDGLYVLQLNADGLPDQIDIVSTATDVIDAETTIT
jgi:hypothetical protein